MLDVSDNTRNQGYRVQLSNSFHYQELENPSTNHAFCYHTNLSQQARNWSGTCLPPATRYLYMFGMALVYPHHQLPAHVWSGTCLHPPTRYLHMSRVVLVYPLPPLPAHVCLMTLDMTPSVHSLVLRSNSPYSSPRDNALGFSGKSFTCWNV